MQLVKYLRHSIGWLGDYQAIASLIPSSVLSVVTAWSATAGGVGLHWIIFTTAGVFLFVYMSVLLAMERNRAYRMQHKITVSDIKAEQWVQSSEPTMALMKPTITLHNIAGFEIFFKLEEADYSFGPHRGAQDRTVNLTGLIAPQGSAGIVLPGFLANERLSTGRLRILVKYGRDNGIYTHSMDTVLEVSPASGPPLTENGHISMLRVIQSLKYQELSR